MNPFFKQWVEKEYGRTWEDIEDEFIKDGYEESVIQEEYGIMLDHYEADKRGEVHSFRILLWKEK
jgi:hypothetical protein